MIRPFDFDHLRNLAIGTVDYVSPTEIKVLLDLDAPQNTALNTGTPSLFPKINGFVLIPNEVGAVVGLINWIAVEHSQYPKRKGFKDYDLIDLPFPLRKMSINPIGTLKQKGKTEDKEYELERGVYTFPSIGDSVILPSEYQLKSIVENKETNATVIIGRATLAGNSDVKINPDKLFGRHLAILGNTGSGKSCSVAGLIRWSLESAKCHIDESNEKQPGGKKKSLNARFIILDPNGEYSQAFDGIDKPVRKYKVKFQREGAQDGSNQLKIPAWMWNSLEWINFSQAQPGAQRPMLLQSLTDLKRGFSIGNSITLRVHSFLTTSRNQLLTFIANLPTQTNTAAFIGMCKALENFSEDSAMFQGLINEPNPDLGNSLDELHNLVNATLARRRWTEGRYNAFSHKDIQELLDFTETILSSIQEEQVVMSPINADTPLQFNIDELTPYLEQLAQNQGGNALQFVQMMSLRMRFLLTDERLKSVVKPDNEITLFEWLQEYIGKSNSENGQVAIIDLSLIPSDVVHIIVAVLSRLVFEAIQRYRRCYQKELPTVVVLEEAHNFIRDSHIDNTNQAQLCRETFERIAREGRKFGLSMVLSSQRPSELSPTVLSQCNTFLLHRIVNDRDQELVKRLVPDNIGGLLKELPILPTRKAILLGWASPIPILVEMRDLPKEHRPQSSDPKFWDVWVGNEERVIDWQVVVDDWQGVTHVGNVNVESLDDGNSIAEKK
jgi:Predicted ATPase